MQFYILNIYLGSNIRLYAGGQDMIHPIIRCPACNSRIDDEGPSETHIALDHIGRQGFTEHLWSGVPIFRADLVALWRSAGLTGFAVKKVKIVTWHNRPRRPVPENIPEYLHLVTTSKVRLLEPPPIESPCPQCGFVKYAFPRTTDIHLDHGIRIDLSSWDGSDFFSTAGYGFVFCTRRVAEVTLNAGFNKRIVFIKVDDYDRWEEFDYDKWTLIAYHEYREQFLIRRVEDL